MGIRIGGIVLTSNELGYPNSACLGLCAPETPPWKDDEFEKKAKELIALFDEPINLINGQVQDFEEKRKAEKHEQVVAIFEEITKTIKDYCPISRFYDDRWDNVSVSLAGAKKDIQTLTDKIQSELSVIKAMNSECETKALERYKAANNLADAVLFINQYEKQKSDILKAEEERKLEEERKKIEEERKLLEPVVEEPLKDFGHVFEPQQEVVFEKPVEEFKLCYQYTIKGTKRELEAIDTFLDSIGVDWSK